MSHYLLEYLIRNQYSICITTLNCCQSLAVNESMRVVGLNSLNIFFVFYVLRHKFVVNIVEIVVFMYRRCT